MKEHKKNLKDFKIDNSWSLFLDRDGVINKRIIGDYVKTVNEFEFLKGNPDSIVKLSNLFGKVFVVTNQQGIGKGIMTHEDLKKVHDLMLSKIESKGARIDEIYYAPQLAKENSVYRKPNNGMALKAKEDFPEISFQKSIMVGDSISDIEFGKKSGMITVFINPNVDNSEAKADFVFDSLLTFANEFI